jgi:2-keto-4-pentenoate hydratase/2-oxohepta-3-ene-1,7-dioic acid hydratase in catechol pathway
MDKQNANIRLVRFTAAGGAARPGLLAGDQVLDLQAAGIAATIDEVLEQWDTLKPRLAKLATSRDVPVAVPLGQATLLAPVPTGGTLYCAGANYRDHVAEMARLRGSPVSDEDKEPWFFVKPTRASVTGPGRVVRPEGCQQLDWEAELAVVIGRKARGLTVDEALSVVACYTVANDLSARDLSRRNARPQGNPFYYDWLAHKGFDGACPIGPWLTPADGIDPQNLHMRLAVNGVTKQDSSTAQMIFSVAQQIAHLSRRTTLFPGDILLTGTPAGVGSGRGEFLQPGDRVSVEIEGLGELVTQIVETGAAA